jgi:hypothetical protein
MLDLGDCFVFRSGSDGNHLWVVISDPVLNPDVVLITNLSSIKGRPLEDLSCTFDPGEHPWIVNGSYVVYSKARSYTLAQLSTMVASKTLVLQAVPFSIPLVKRIHSGAVITRRLAQEHLNQLRDQGFVR